jgi:hypothetical protein
MSVVACLRFYLLHHMNRRCPNLGSALVITLGNEGVERPLLLKLQLRRQRLNLSLIHRRGMYNLLIYGRYGSALSFRV